MRRILLSVALLSPLACERQVAKAPDPAATTQPVTAADPHAGLTPPPVAVPTEPAQAGGLTWEAPAAFVRRAPKSSMRAAEYGLKSAPAAELGVFYFGPDQGGSVDANMSRWIGQFTQADGSETKAKRSEVTHNGVQIDLVEAAGMFAGGMAMPGGPQPTALPDAALLGAIAKGPEGSVFFKLTGPRDAIEGARGGFDELLRSITKK
ncbi:MAG TPA: hypothetical protein VFX59_11015 [Polyangiales bacterium]|nr:hypothetical protein [Polyangiales bacterium]